MLFSRNHFAFILKWSLKYAQVGLCDCEVHAHLQGHYWVPDNGSCHMMMYRTVIKPTQTVGVGYLFVFAASVYI